MNDNEEDLDYEKKYEETSLFDLYHISSILCHWSELVATAEDPKDRERKRAELGYLVTLCYERLNRAIAHI